jgi:hypothetical protein
MNEELPDRPPVGTEAKYGRILTERGDPGRRDGEPLFLLRGQDALAGFALRAYRDFCIATGCDPAQIDGVSAALERFTDWAGANPDRMKLPGPLAPGASHA